MAREPIVTGGGAPDDQRARERAQHHEGSLALRHRLRQQRVHGIVGDVLAAGEEAHEGAPLVRPVAADRAAQHRVPRFQRVEHRAPRRRTVHPQRHLALDAREGPQVRRQLHPDHGRVCASTDSTAGRSRTIGAQVSPASADA